jgi:isopenicillin N synthase-like dioxygenase
VSPAPHLPVVDIAGLIDRSGSPTAAPAAAAAIDRACRTVGFFAVTGHGVRSDLQPQLEDAAHAFFRRSDAAKAEVEMARAGAAWRGWFPVGGELTSGVSDHKEGIYFGLEHAADHHRVASSTPLHGANQFPSEPSELRPLVLDWLAAMRPVADAVMRGIALGLGLTATWFEDRLTADPTILFRIFHYPPDDPANSGTWGVGEHTDYGLLTLLAQDHHGGLQVKGLDGNWIDVAPEPGILICNIGDMLERLTGGRYRSTPHRVRNVSGESRLSFPYFFDPSWDATVPTLPLGRDAADHVGERWDGADVLAWEGTYGDYLTAKVAKVFPDLFGTVTTDTSTKTQ